MCKFCPLLYLCLLICHAITCKDLSGQEGRTITPIPSFLTTHTLLSLSHYTLCQQFNGRTCSLTLDNQFEPFAVVSSHWVVVYFVLSKFISLRFLAVPLSLSCSSPLPACSSGPQKYYGLDSKWGHIEQWMVGASLAC